MSHSTMLEVARNLIRDLLADGPMKGATLKLRMLSAFEKATGETFNAAFRIYPKFSSFLLANTDLVDIQRPGPGLSGDILVGLRAEREGSRETLDLLSPPTLYLQNDVWQAFTNPDPDRLRYVERATGRVVHYRNDNPPPELTGSPLWVEIKPVPAREQARWMHEFIDVVALPDGRRDVLVPIADMPYSATSNALFSKTLAEYTDVWRRFRAGQVMRAAREWSKQTGMPFEKIAHPVKTSPSTPTEDNRETSLRNALIKAIQAATLEELRQISVPATLLTVHLNADGR